MCEVLAIVGGTTLICGVAFLINAVIEADFSFFKKNKKLDKVIWALGLSDGEHLEALNRIITRECREDKLRAAERLLADDRMFKFLERKSQSRRRSNGKSKNRR